MYGYSSAGICGSDDNGRRRPIGESPGVRNRLPRRNFQRSLFQRDDGDASAFQRWIGSTNPFGVFSPWSNTRAIRERSSGSASFESLGSTLGGRPASFCSQCEGSSNAGMMNSESRPSFFAAAAANRSASAMPALRGPSTAAIKSGFFQIGTPSLRQYSPKAQRGRLSPGYHLPWP